MYEHHNGTWFEVDYHWNGKTYWKVYYEIQTTV